MSADSTHFGPGSAVAGARTWLERVLLDGDLRAAWPHTESVLRHRLVTVWAAERARLRSGAPVAATALVAALSAQDPEDDDAWAAFADAQVRELRRLCRYVDLSAGGGWAGRPEAESPDCELVLLAEAGELYGLEEPASLPAHALLMRHDPAEGWRVAELR